MANEWFQTFFDGLYADVLPRTFEEQATLEQAGILRDLLQLKPGADVLDVPCGVGRLTLPLARMGYRMTGVDLTAGYIEAAGAAAREQECGARFVRRDMREIEFEGEFTAAFNWFGSFGYFSDDENLQFAKRVLRALRPGGRFLIEGMNKSRLLTHFLPRTEQEINGVHILHENGWDADTDRVRSTWTLSRGTRSETHRLLIRVFNGGDLRALLRRAGFRDTILCGGYPPVGRLTRHSRRLIAVSRKPEEESGRK